MIQLRTKLKASRSPRSRCHGPAITVLVFVFVVAFWAIFTGRAGAVIE
jgi:hypothetical protein